MRNFAWLLVGIHQSRSVTLSKIAVKIPGEAKLLSTVRRLGRFLSNPAIRVRDWYEPIARQWLAAQFRYLGEIRLIVDGTKIGARHQLLIVCLSYRKRAIPIAWTWVRNVRGHSSAVKQLALRFYTLRPWIEEMFGDFKKHGFDLENAKFCHFQRLSRLTMAVVILYVWLVSVGTQAIHAGDHHLVDRRDRRDLSTFQIAYVLSKGV